MIKSILLLHFLMGAIFPFIANQAHKALEKLRYNSEWLDSGFVQHNEYRITQYHVLLWLVILIAFVCLYFFIVYQSFQLLYTH